jgi:hypothetical protein
MVIYLFIWRTIRSHLHPLEGKSARIAGFHAAPMEQAHAAWRNLVRFALAEDNLPAQPIAAARRHLVFLIHTKDDGLHAVVVVGNKLTQWLGRAPGVKPCLAR